MAIFGSFKDISIIEILPLIEHQQGWLHAKTQTTDLVLRVEGGRIKCAFANGHPLNRAQLIDVVTALTEEKEGRFRFDSEASATRATNGGVYTLRDRCQREPIDMPLNLLMLQVTTLKDEINSSGVTLPHPKAVFTLNEGMVVKNVDSELHTFLERAKNLLRKGANAEELAQALNLPLIRARYLLHKARLVHAIQLKAKPRRPRTSTLPFIRKALKLLRRYSFAV